MNESERRAAAKQFVADWANRGDERQDAQSFWRTLLQKVFGVDEPEKYISFERRVEVDDIKTGKRTTKFIDGYIPSTKVLIEQKKRDINLRAGQKQSDGAMLSPYQQARRYGGYLPQPEQPRWIIVCNFQQFNIHDMTRPNDEPEIVLLCDLEKEFHRLDFLVDTTSEHIKKEMEISLKAGDIVQALYNALLKQYKDPDDPETLRSLNALCVRIVFCLYAEDADVFGRPMMFHDYLKAHERDARRALIDLFRVLDQKTEDRDPYIDDDLAAFPYVNGGLFSDENIVIPRLSDEIVSLILNRASAGFDWSAISPTIFGAVFESTLNPETRRTGGMHYTSIENIHKVIDPLFLSDLRAELDEIKLRADAKTRKKKLAAFQQKLAGLAFLDPACGSGNFLTETYLSLRRLENEIISAIYDEQLVSTFLDPIQVSISQFHGIEINDFAVSVAKTALWIAESQMMRETEAIVHMSLDFLPLKTNANIVEGNALQLDWESVVPKYRLNYIMGNPPFVGFSFQSAKQKNDILSVYIDEKGKPYKTAGKIDYVSGWYFKAAAMMSGTHIRAAFVSTNSVTQGEQVAGVWRPLFNRFNVHIDFAYRPFKWDSEANMKAHVHCVIIGFSSAPSEREKLIFTSDREQHVSNINAYLTDAPNVFIDSHIKPLCDVPTLQNGGKPTEGGNLILTFEEKNELVSKEPLSEQFIRPYMMGKDFIQRKPRYCLWLVGANPSTVKKCPEVLKRVNAVREYRLASPKPATRKKAETPMLFDEVRECTSSYVAIPKVSSENRRYIPMDYLSREIIPGDKLFMMQDATLYEFGVLTSNVHMAWMRAVCGRLEMRYSYSNTVVYNNFPWPTPTEEQKAKIERTAQAILDARALYPDCSLADLYDETVMPPELRTAHQNNDRAVMQAYGFDVKSMTESSCVAALMKLYVRLVEQKG